MATGKAPKFPLAVAKVEVSGIDVRLFRSDYADLMALLNKLTPGLSDGAGLPTYLGYSPVTAAGGRLSPKKDPRAWWHSGLRRQWGQGCF